MPALSDLLPAEQILWRLPATTKKGILETLAQTAEAASGGQLRCDDLLCELIAREKLGTTLLTDGVALPHLRSEAVRKPVCIFVRLEAPVVYTMDDETIHSLFFVASPLPPGSQKNDTAHKNHLALLAVISQLVLDDAFAAAIADAPDAAAVHKKLIAWEQQHAESLPHFQTSNSA